MPNIYLTVLGLLCCLPSIYSALTPQLGDIIDRFSSMKEGLTDQLTSQDEITLLSALRQWKKASRALHRSGQLLHQKARDHGLYDVTVESHLGLDEFKKEEIEMKRHLANIVGGSEVTVMGKYPWQCSVRNYGSHFCGCSLIHPQYALTAAHCDVNPVAGLEVALGTLNMFDENVQYYKVAERIPHEGYVYNLTIGLPNDIMLLKLEQPITLAPPNITLIKVPPKGTNFVNTECHVSGWGSVSFTEQRANDQLKETESMVICNEACKEVPAYDISIRDNQLCHIDDDTTSAQCVGDSGGPFVCRKGGEWMQAGVVSWNEDCQPNFPSVTTRLSEFRPWLCEHGALEGDDC